MDAARPLRLYHLEVAAGSRAVGHRAQRAAVDFHPCTISLSLGRESDIPELLMGDILALRLHTVPSCNEHYVQSATRKR
jgi:hypothetical protein